MSDIFPLLFAPASQLVKQIVDEEAHGFSFFDETVNKFSQNLLLILLAPCFEMAGAHKRPHPSSRFQNSRSFELGVDLGDGIRVDAQVDSQLTDCRESFTDPQPACSYRKLNCSRELSVKRHRMRRV
jgi:hypothetical protein